MRLLLIALAMTAATPGWLGMDYTWSHAAKTADRVLIVQRVAANGPAQRAGVRPGDIITAMNGRRVGIGDELELLLFLGEQHPGDRLTLSIIREGRPMQTVVTLGTMSAASLAARKENLEVARRRRVAASPSVRDGCRPLQLRS